MAAANDLRRGMAIKYNGNAAIVLEVHHRTPGNLRAFVQAIIRYINTGKSADVRFGSTDKVELVEIERKSLEVSHKVVESPEGLRGDTASNVTKPAVLETGKTINVPLFIKEGENIKIDTRTGSYMGRA